MNVKTIAISLYLMLLYWISLRYPALKTVFYPTVGAFCYLFVTRTFHIRELANISIGAVIASLLGCLLHAAYPGPISFLLNSLLVIWMIRKFKWNAPPILAVSLVPFFITPVAWWVVPVSVLATLSGLLLVVGGLHYIVEYSRPILSGRLSGQLREMDQSREMN